jgi:PadR family transcriptional regulator, regulatory protein PadR
MHDIFRDIFLSFVRVHLLHHAAEGPIYGLEMIEELARHGYELSPGTLYPILHGLEAAGYLAAEPQTVNGKVRKYYRITGMGQEALARLRPKIGELVREVLAEQPGRSDSFAHAAGVDGK